MFDSFILTAIFISLLAGQFARIELINALANVYVHEFFLLIFVCRSIVQFGLVPIRNIFKSKQILIFFFIILISFFISIKEFTLLQNGIALLYLGRLILYVLFGIYLFALAKRERHMRIFIFNLIYTFSILLLITTAIQYVFFPNFWKLYALGWDPHLYRASAIYFDVYIAAAIYGLLAFFWFSKNKKILSFLFIIALVLTFSRSAYIAFVLSMLYFFITQKKWKELFISLCLFGVLILVVPKPFGEGVNLLRTSSINSRILDYKLGLSLWQKKPLFGFGYNRIRFAKEELNLALIDDKSHSLSSFHSSFLIILVTTGIVGFISFVILLISFLKKYPKLRVYVLFILSMSLFDNVLLHVLVLLPCLFLAAHLIYWSFE